MLRSWRFAVAVSLVLIVALRAMAGGIGETGTVDPKGVIEYLEGEVLLNGGEAVIGQEVTPGAVIETAENSYCEVVFAGHNIFRIEALSMARIEIVEPRGKITLEEGALAAVFQKIQRLNASGGFRLETPTAVAGIRGTAFYIRLEDPNNTYICTCNGATRLADRAESFRRFVKSDRHKALRFSRQGEQIWALSAPLLYHDNPYMDALAAKIHSRIPWGAGGSEAGY